MRAALALAGLIDAVNERIGRAVAWLTLTMVLLQFAIVAARYVYGVGSTAAQESVVYLHASVFMLGAAYTLAHDQHVRCDIALARASPRLRALVDLGGLTFCVAPLAAVIAWTAWPYVSAAWSVREGSAEGALGLPYVYLLKSLIPTLAVLLLAQGLACAIRRLAVLRQPAPETGPPDRPRTASRRA